MRRAPPLRFLALVLGGWVCFRAAVLAPGLWTDIEPAAVAAAASRPGTARTRDPLRVAAPAAVSSPVHISRSEARPARPARTMPITASPIPQPVPSIWIARPSRAPSAQFAPGPPAPAALTTPTIRPASRWSGAAWLLLRGDRGTDALAPGGTLGGSQAGARLLYRVGGGLALSARAYAPLRRTGGAEAAAGMDWRPSARIPVHVLVERRQDLGGEGRSAFALTLYGGLERRLPGGVRAKTYGQAGMVGLRSRDLFVDGAARLSLPVGPVEIGGGAWGAAQPGVARLDAGPTISYRLPVRGANLRLQVDWRFRIAGDAAPDSGPALTLAADF